MAAAKKKPWKTGASSGHIRNLKQSILETFDIYGKNPLGKVSISSMQKTKQAGPTVWPTWLPSCPACFVLGLLLALAL
jgi:hypothetical protein